MKRRKGLLSRESGEEIRLRLGRARPRRNTFAKRMKRGSDCSKVVGRVPRDQEVVGSNPFGLFLNLSFHTCSLETGPLKVFNCSGFP